MSLKALKSAFSNMVEAPSPEGRHVESPTTNTPFLPNSILDATTYAYNSLLDEPITDTPLFNVPSMSDFYNNPDTTTTLNDPSSDIRFQVGLGFPSPNTKIVMAREGAEASIAYFQTATGDAMMVASGAITKLGSASEKLAKIGIDTPTFDFGISVPNPFGEGTLLGSLSKPDPVPLFLTYPMGVEEMFNPDGGNLTDEFANTGDPESTRGIAYQVLGDQNKKGQTPDFKFQDAVQNEKTVEYINPITGFTPGNIEFKDNYFKDIGKSLGSLGDALGPGDGIGDIFGAAAIGGLMGGLPGAGALAGIKFLSENDRIRDLFDSKGGIFKEIGGFGKGLDLPKFPKIDIDFSKIGNFFSGIGDSLFGGIGGKKGGGFGSKLGEKLGGLSDSIKDIAGPIGAALKDLKSNLNPLDELTLPKIDLQNPRQVSVTDYGGQAIFKSNTPRALERETGLIRTAPSQTKDAAYVEDPKQQVSTPYSQLGKVIYAGVGTVGKLRAPSAYYPNKSMDEKAGGDQFTLAPIHNNLSDYDDQIPNWIDSEDNGMPFFFKDLRNNSFIIFRGYLSGISDNMSPAWSEQAYIGRAEKNWVYTGADRSISCTLKLAAQTALELDSIYYKLNKLTGMVYPEYMPDQFLQTGTGSGSVPEFKVRMKPPLARMRLGDLFGNPTGKTKEGVLGFLKSLSYSWPDEAPWETRKGQRVPKIIEVSIEWQVIHERVPDMKYPEFYGYNPDRLGAEERAANKKSSAGLLNQNNLTAEEQASLGVE